jgi:hypothetical protein
LPDAEVVEVSEPPALSAEEELEVTLDADAILRTG